MVSFVFDLEHQFQSLCRVSTWSVSYNGIQNGPICSMWRWHLAYDTRRRQVRYCRNTSFSGHNSISWKPFPVLFFSLGPLAHHGHYSLSHVKSEWIIRWKLYFQRQTHLKASDWSRRLFSHSFAPKAYIGKTLGHHVVLLVGNTTISVLWKFSMSYA